MSGCTPCFPWIPFAACFICISTQLLTVELYIMILEVTLICILMQDEYLERLEFSSVSFIVLLVRLLFSLTCFHCMLCIVSTTDRLLY